MRHTICVALIVTIAASAAAETVYQQPPKPNGPFYQSARWGENGSDYDKYVWDSFQLATTRSITEVHWRGGYNGAVAPIDGFEVNIYKSIPAGSQPDLGGPPLVHYFFNGNAGETPAGSAGGIAVYDYHVTLPTAFQATGGTKYWVEILAWQNGFPFWSLQAGDGGNGSHFEFWEGAAMYFSISGDTSFSLVAAPLPCPADLDHNGHVDAADLSILLGAWGGSGASDLNGDGVVNAADLSVLLGAWGNCA
ncbi:MAG: hypothetical protein U0572_01265 [Phycisphaerales bacterium]